MVIEEMGIVKLEEEMIEVNLIEEDPKKDMNKKVLKTNQAEEDLKDKIELKTKVKTEMKIEQKTEEKIEVKDPIKIDHIKTEEEDITTEIMKDKIEDQPKEDIRMNKISIEDQEDKVKIIF